MIHRKLEEVLKAILKLKELIKGLGLAETYLLNEQGKKLDAVSGDLVSGLIRGVSSKMEKLLVHLGEIRGTSSTCGTTLSQRVYYTLPPQLTGMLVQFVGDCTTELQGASN